MRRKEGMRGGQRVFRRLHYPDVEIQITSQRRDQEGCDLQGIRRKRGIGMQIQKGRMRKTKGNTEKLETEQAIIAAKLQICIQIICVFYEKAP